MRGERQNHLWRKWGEGRKSGRRKTKRFFGLGGGSGTLGLDIASSRTGASDTVKRIC